MDHKTYLSQLRRLPITNPASEDLTLVCPHLPPDQAVESFNERGLIACPPVRVSNVVQVVALRPAEEMFRDEYKDNQRIRVSEGIIPPRLEIAFVSTMNLLLPHAEEASRYAKSCWPDQLVPSGPRGSTIRIRIDDPAEMNEWGLPKTVRTVFLALNRSVEELTQLKTQPLSGLVNSAINGMTVCEIIGSEYAKDRKTLFASNCARCGSGLHADSCLGCKRTFARCPGKPDWNMPLPQKVCDLLARLGHVFEVNPQIAHAKEIENFEQSRLVHIRL